jgi:hypothetical protein
MFKRSMLVMSALSMIAIPTASEARHHHGYYDNGYYGGGYGQGYAQQQGYYAPQGYYQQQGYYAPQGYYQQQAYGYGNGYDGRGYAYRQHRCSGTTGTIIGAGAGALIGRSIGRGSGYYHQNSGTTGTIIGAALGALAGRQIGKSTC